MKTSQYLITLCAVLTIAGFTTGKVLASGYYSGGHKTNYCSKTAKTLYQACYFDVLDDYNETRANCINVTDEDARQECFDSLRGSLGEEWGSCKEQKDARRDVCEQIGEARYADPLKDPEIEFINLEDADNPLVPNPYVDLTVGHTYVLRAGEDFEETVVIHVTDEVREAEGAPGDYSESESVFCRVVVDAVMIYDEEEGEWEGEEVTDDYFAQDDAGIVYYCGEISRNFEDGYLSNLDGSFFSGVEYAKAGILMRPASPALGHVEVGRVDRQEYAIAEAEDVVEYLNLNATPEDEGVEDNPNPLFACGEAMEGECIQTFDSSALDPDSTEFKYYRAGVGFVLAVSMDDGEFDGEREELLCAGESLDILNSCGEGEDQLQDVPALLVKLCELAPQAFCANEE